MHQSMASLPFELGTALRELGDVGHRIVQLGAAEGGAGNLSVCLDHDPGIASIFPHTAVIDLPVVVPALAGHWLLVTGSARRLRDLAQRPEQTLCCLLIKPGGLQATLFSAVAIRPTSELNSHLLVHHDQIEQHHMPQHAVAHCQPPYLTYLSHLADPADGLRWMQDLLRWQPETILEFPEGIALLPFETPGSAQQASTTRRHMQQHRAVVWQRHGIVVRATAGIEKAADLVEYAEAAARYCYLNLVAGSPTSGLSDDELRATCAAYGVGQSLF
ncbi:MAG: hypothetical protein NVS4B8_15550 [Herpetosiphon sp.]